MSWNWHTDPLTYKDLCAHCQLQLRLGGQVVKWVDGSVYHVGCLLDRIAAYQQPPLPHWGMMGVIPVDGTPHTTIYDFVYGKAP